MTVLTHRFFHLHHFHLQRRLSLATAIFGVLPAMAQVVEKDTTFHLNEVVVTATRTPKLLKDTPIQTRIITTDDIKRVDATNIQDLLQQEMPGVEFTYAMNQQTHLNFSGFGGQSILILVDGERLAGETMDDVDFSRLAMDDVQRIEIVKGAASALYGSNANGGVVNIITKEGGAPWTLNVNTRFARHNEQRHGASFGLNNSRWSNTLHVNYNGSDNYDVTNGPNPQTQVYSIVFGDKTLHAKDKLTFHPDKNLSLTGHAGYFFRTLTRTADTPERYRDFTGGLRGQWEMSAHDHLEASFQFDQYDKSDYLKRKDLDIRDYSNVQNTFRTLYSHHFGKNILTLGGDYMHDYLYNPRLKDGSRAQDAFDAFAQLDWNANEQWEVVGALRYDHFSEGSLSRLTPKLNMRYQASNHLTLRMGYGMGFRAPTLKEKYYIFDMVGIWIVEGNSELEPETSHNLNASLEWVRRNLCLTASTYYNHVDHKITTGMPYFKPGNHMQPYLNYLNLDGYNVYGAEATIQARWTNGLSFKASYAFTKENLSKGANGESVNNQYLPAREHTLVARMAWDKQWNKYYGLNIAINGRALSEVKNVEYIDYYDTTKGTQTITYPAYTIWKLSTTHRIGKAVTITLALDNLFNYKPEYHYLNSPVTDGINVLAGLSIDVDRWF